MDVDAYFERIGYSGPTTVTEGTLEALHLAHALHVPFENADIHLGLPIKLDLPSLEDKIVRHRRGGYCFEQNTLFASVLERLGFAVTPLAARVRVGAEAVMPRTHMLLRVDVGPRALIADVGFGACNLLPIPLAAGQSYAHFDWTFSLGRDGDAWVLRTKGREGWTDLYAFTLERQYPVDYEVKNHYTSTHPLSRFVQILTAQRVTQDTRYILRNADYEIIRASGERTTRTIGSHDELLALLAETYSLRFPEGTRFPKFP